MVFRHRSDEHDDGDGWSRYGPNFGHHHRIERHGRGLGQPANEWYGGSPPSSGPSRTPAAWEVPEFWRAPGPYTGLGPLDYQRDPKRILEDVNERLTQHGLIDATRIQATCTAQGEVTLTGEVQTRREKRMAEDVADSVFGVRDVHNQLRALDPARHQQPSGARTWRRWIRVGMLVSGREGAALGQVTKVRQYDFLVDVGRAREVYVPHDAIMSIFGDHVMLDVRAEEIEDYGRETAESDDY